MLGGEVGKGGYSYALAHAATCMLLGSGSFMQALLHMHAMPCRAKYRTNENKEWAKEVRILFMHVHP